MQILASGLLYPEGPVALPDGSVLVVELAGEALKRVRPDGKVEVVAKIPGSPNGAAMGPNGKVYICNNGGLRFINVHGTLRTDGQSDDYRTGSIDVVDLNTGKVERLYDRCGQFQLKGPNDIVFDHHGGFYFTDFGKRRDRDMDRGYVYWAKADGSEIREVISRLVMPNGIGLSPDGKTLYVAETHAGRLWGFEVAEPGVIRKIPWPASPYGGRLIADPGHYTQYDSLAVASSGRICVAAPEGSGIQEIAPDGSQVWNHKVPDMLASNICFGGKDLRTAFITGSHEGRLFKMEWHEPGLRLPHQEI